MPDEPEAADILGRRIRAGDVVWIAAGRGSSAAAMEQRRVLAVLPPLRTWSRPDNDEPRLRVRSEPGLVGPAWMAGRPSIVEYPGRTLLHLGAAG